MAISVSYSGEDVNGANLVDALIDESVHRITIESGKAPSIGFCDTLHKDFNFATVSCVEQTDGKFLSVFERDE